MNVFKTMLLAGLAALSLTASAQATPLLGVQSNLAGTLIDYDAGGTISYNATTNILTMSATVIPPSAGLDFTDLLPNGGSILLSVEVDETGMLVSGVGGLSVYSGTGALLLTGDVTAFGWEAGTVDKFDFLLANLGGPKAGLFTDPGMFANVDTVGSFGGDFTSNFSRTPTKGGVGNLIPEPNTALMAGIALAFVRIRSRRR